MNFDFQAISKGKAAHRRKLAALPLGEKLRLLDAMRERAVALHGSSRKGMSPSLLREEPAEYRADGKPGEP